MDDGFGVAEMMTAIDDDGVDGRRSMVLLGEIDRGSCGDLRWLSRGGVQKGHVVELGRVLEGKGWN